ncbi:endonuclease/exonuclease/phosphatase family protein [Streptomyces sp. NPDC037389]|uniref:endonuclease/exonuclease/phosphatase family protein n=1 Tax=Streptomyces sp. NPDC037389 TaxID=3155369 RepID=UPI0033E92299
MKGDRPGTAAGSLRILTWNVQSASPVRSRAQVAWLASQEHADTVVLTEVGAGPGGTALVQALSGAGYRGLISPASRGDYRTVLATRLPHLTSLPSPVVFLPHRAPAARLTIGAHTVTLVGLYVPSRGPRERRNEDKRAFQASVAATLRQLAEETGRHLVFVAGDLNVVEPGHRPHHAVFGAWEYDFYRAFAAAGFTDAYRHLNPDVVEHSWFGRTGNGYRFDHTFITSRHRHLLTACSYLHDPRQEGLSDHAAMTVRAALCGSEPADSRVSGR